MPETCHKCRLKRKDENLVGCEGPCGCWFHSECILMSDAEFKVLHKSRNLFFICNMCKPKIEIVDKSKREKVFSDINSIGSTVSKLMSEDYMKNIIESFRQDMMAKMELSFEMLETKIKSSLSEKLSDCSPNLLPSKEPSYAQTLKSRVVLQPKNTSQQATTTKAEILQKANPIVSNISISNVQTSRNGSLVVSCVNEEHSAKFKKIITSNLGDKYDVRNIPTLNPRIRITNMCEQFSDSDLVNYVITQNTACFNENSVCQLVSVRPQKRNNKLFQAVLQVDLESYLKVIKAGKLNVGFDFDCPVYCAIEPRKCFNCCGFHHIANQCKNEPICPKCSSNHKLSDCRSNDLICVHCITMRNNLKIDIPTNHAAWDPNCYVYKKTLSKFRDNVLSNK